MAIYYKGERIDDGGAACVMLDYAGDGTTNRSVEFPRKPVVVFVRQMNGSYELCMIRGETCCQCRGPDASWPNIVEWTDRQVSWSMAEDSGGRYGPEYQCNKQGKHYRLIALLEAE